MEYYHVEIHVSPAKDSHEIGAQVTLNCIVTPSPVQKYYGKFAFPRIYYHWYSTSRGPLSSTSDNSITITMNTYQRSVDEYYCLIYRYSNGPVLGTGRTTLIVAGNSNNVDCLLYDAIYSTLMKVFLNQALI